MKKVIVVLSILIFFAGSVFSDGRKIGSAGAQFLKIGVGSKYQGIGEAAVATANDVYAAYWNPAGLVGVENSQISFTNVNYLLDINLNYIAYAKSFEDVGVFAFSVTMLSMDDQEVTTLQEQDGTGEYYSASSYALAVSYARQLNARFSFGGTIKYIGESIYNEKSSGFAVDFGTMLYTGYKSLRLGMSITNMGPEMKFSGSDLIVNYDEQSGQGSNDPVSAELKSNPYELPMIFRVGLAYDFEVSPNSIVTVSSELKHPNDNEQQGAFGAQFSYDEKFFLRGGYKINYTEESFALGGGLNTSLTENTNLVINYAWQDFGRLKSTQRFSIGFIF